MCGICGWIARAGVDLGALEEMNRRAAHRGPDGQGYWTWDGEHARGWFDRERAQAPPGGRAVAGLGHRRLAILDLSEHGLQPMGSPDGQCWGVINGEIYNYLELREELRGLGYAFSTGTDTEVALAAYRQWGTGCFRRFNGMWGLALVDLRARKLIFSRDRFGIKPLYLWVGKEGLAFASEIKQFFALPGVTAQANLEVLAGYIENGYETPPETFFREITAFPAAHWGETSLDDPTVPMLQAYWSAEEIEVQPVGFDQAVEQTAALFEQAVRLCLRSDVPVGVCLSGGLDSSAVYGTMRNLLGSGGPELHAFSAAFENQRFDERPYIRQVIEKHGGEVHYAFPTADDFLAEMEAFLYQHDEPPGSLSQYAAWGVMRLARENGVPVLLNGQGGDELLAGYWPAYYLYLGWLARRQPLRAAGDVVGSVLPGGNDHLLRQLLPHLRQYWHRKERQGASFLPPGRSRQKGNWAVAAQRLDPAAYRRQEAFQVHLPRLLKWDDRNSMAFSIEGRYPFLDTTLVDWLLSLPPELNLGRGWNKRVFRKALAPVLPEVIRRRRDKVGFVTPQSQWLQTTLRAALLNWVEQPSAELRSLVDVPGLQGLVRRLFAAQEIQRMDESQFLVMRLFFLEQWMRIYRVQV